MNNLYENYYIDINDSKFRKNIIECLMALMNDKIDLLFRTQIIPPSYIIKDVMEFREKYDIPEEELIINVKEIEEAYESRKIELVKRERFSNFISVIDPCFQVVKDIPFIWYTVKDRQEIAKAISANEFFCFIAISKEEKEFSNYMYAVAYIEVDEGAILEINKNCIQEIEEIILVLKKYLV